MSHFLRSIPEDVKRVWKIKPGDKEALIAASQEANNAAILKRCWMIRVLNHSNKGQLLAPWKHGEELDDAVFRLAATFPIRPLRQHTYTVPGDSLWGFDPNAFVEKLIEETGISHTWEPVLARNPEGSSSCTYTKTRASVGPRDPQAAKEALKKRIAGELSEREAKLDARELLWAVWSKCQPKLSRASTQHELAVAGVAMLFADFAIDNIDLAREFLSGPGSLRLETVLQLERNAVWGDLECTVCQRPMQEHSDEEMAHCRQAVLPGSPPFRWRTS